MADLIDRAALLERLANIKDSTNWDEQSRGVIMGFEIFINKSPAVDAVEVVRCKECKHRADRLYCRLRKTPVIVTNVDFCSYGERRADNDTRNL